MVILFGMALLQPKALATPPTAPKGAVAVLANLAGIVQQSTNGPLLAEAPPPMELPAPVEAPQPEVAPAVQQATPKIWCSSQEIAMIEYVVEREVRGASYNHKKAVANVIVNRVMASQFPGTVTAVLHAPKQFPISIQNYYRPKWHPSDETINAVYAAIYEPDTTGGALYFYAPQYTKGKTARWFERSLTFCFEMEGHRFFK